MAPVPPGIRLLVSFNRDQWYRALTFAITFLLYTSFHLSRKPISIVKSELHKNCSSAGEAYTVGSGSMGTLEPHQPSLHSNLDCSWKPFDKSNYKQLLGAMDYSFLCAYAVGMYVSGIIGERLPIRLYLTVGMLTSGLFTCLFGLGYIYNVHNLSFYIFVQEPPPCNLSRKSPLEELFAEEEAQNIMSQLHVHEETSGERAADVLGHSTSLSV